MTSYLSLTPISEAVPGINCISPAAPEPLLYASGLKSDSFQTIDSANLGSTPIESEIVFIEDFILSTFLIINQLGNFDEVTVGSDNDLADAYGIALMQDLSTGTAPRDLNYSLKDDPFMLNSFEDEEEKEKRVSLEQDWKGFGR